MPVAASPDALEALDVDLIAASARQPLGTVAILFRRVPIVDVPRHWRKVSLDLNAEVYLHRTKEAGVSVYAPMRSGFSARLLGRKMRFLGELPSQIADTVLVKLAEDATLRARIVDAPPPYLRQSLPNMGLFISIRCRS